MYNTAVVIPDLNAPYVRVLTYFEKSEEVGGTSNALEPGYFFVKWEPDGSGGRQCEARTEDDYVDTGATMGTPWRESGNVRHSASPGSPFLTSSSPRKLFMVTLNGWMNKYKLGADGYPDCSSDACTSTDILTEHNPGRGPAGADSSLLFLPTQQALVFGTRCPLPAGQNNCTSAAGWGELRAHAFYDGADLDQLEFNAWIFCSPVGVKDEVGTGNGALIAFGTGESTEMDDDDVYDGLSPYDGTYDCQFHTAILESDTLTLTDTWADSDACASGEARGVNAFLGEPAIPAQADRVFVLRRHGEAHTFPVNSAGVIDDTNHLQVNYEYDDGTVAFDNDDMVIPLEHAPTLGFFPGVGGPYNSSRLTLFHTVSTVGEGTAGVNKTIFVVARKPDTETSTGVVDLNLYGSSSLVATIDTSVGEETNAGVKTDAAWGPGAAGRYVKSDGTDPVLAYVYATGAIAAKANPSTTACDANDIPPTLHIWYQTSPVGSWSEDSIALGSTCYEPDEMSNGEYRPIAIQSGVVIVGASVYIATSAGLFFEVNTAASAGSPAPYGKLDGYAGPWPRFRKDNQGSGAAW